MVLAAAGNVAFDDLIHQAEQHCGQWKAFHAPREHGLPQPQRAWQVIQKPQAVQQYIIQLAAAPAAEDEDRYAARLLATIVGDETGSRLFWELVDSGLAESASIGVQEYQRAGLFMTGLSCAPENAAENLRRLKDVVAQVEAEGVTEEELLQAQNKVCAHIVLSSERPTSRMFHVGNSWVQRRQYKTVRENVAAYRAVTLDDLAAVVKKYPLTRNATVMTGPLAELAEPS
jgi:predicted Zn-dependent peptidase